MPTATRLCVRFNSFWSLNCLITIAVDLNNRKVTDNMIVPATALLDLAPIKSQLGQAQTTTAKK